MDHQAFAQLLGNYGELIGAIGVVLTLAYLGVQIRHNTRATRAASHHAITDSLNLGNLAQAQDAELARIWVSGAEDRSALTNVDRHRFDLLLLSYFHVLDSLFYSAKVGTGELSLLQAEEPGLAHFLSLPGVNEWWGQNPYGLSMEFRSYIDALRNQVSA